MKWILISALLAFLFENQVGVIGLPDKENGKNMTTEDPGVTVQVEDDSWEEMDQSSNSTNKPESQFAEEEEGVS